jgi:hypothetical protein
VLSSCCEVNCPYATAVFNGPIVHLIEGRIWSIDGMIVYSGHRKYGRTSLIGIDWEGEPSRYA